MKIVHVANTDFEFELTGRFDGTGSIDENWSRFSLCFQLQFIPLIFAEEQDTLAVTHLPPKEFIKHLSGLNLSGMSPDFILLNEESELNRYDRCESWGFSPKIKKWAESRKLLYSLPERETIKLMNSKAFSCEESSYSEGIELLKGEDDLKEWLKKTKGAKVLKT